MDLHPFNATSAAIAAEAHSGRCNVTLQSEITKRKTSIMIQPETPRSGAPAWEGARFRTLVLRPDLREHDHEMTVWWALKSVRRLHSAFRGGSDVSVWKPVSVSRACRARCGCCMHSRRRQG